MIICQCPSHMISFSTTQFEGRSPNSIQYCHEGPSSLCWFVLVRRKQGRTEPRKERNQTTMIMEKNEDLILFRPANRDDNHHVSLAPVSTNSTTTTTTTTTDGPATVTGKKIVVISSVGEDDDEGRQQCVDDTVGGESGKVGGKADEKAHHADVDTDSNTPYSNGKVRHILTNLVGHYDQEVHNHHVFDPPCMSCCFDPSRQQHPSDHRNDDDRGIPRPYFHDDESSIPQGTIPRVVQFWLDDLKSQQHGTTSVTDQLLPFVEYLEGYEHCIRPLLVPSSSSGACSSVGCVPTLQHFELLLTLWLRQSTTTSSSQTPTTATASTNGNNTTKLQQQMNQQDLDLQTQQEKRLMKIMHILCMDITVWTSPDSTRRLKFFQPPSSNDDDNANVWKKVILNSKKKNKNKKTQKKLPSEQSVNSIIDCVRDEKEDDHNNNADDDVKNEPESQFDHECREYLRTNIILPTLLRLLERSLLILTKMKKPPMPLPSSGSNSTSTATIGFNRATIESSRSLIRNMTPTTIQKSEQTDKQQITHQCLRRVVITLLAFGDINDDRSDLLSAQETDESFEMDNTMISPINVAPSLIDKGGGTCGSIRNHTLEEMCCYPPDFMTISTLLGPDRQIDNELTRKNMFEWIHSNCLSLDNVDWDSVALDTSSWIDTDVGVSLRVVQCIWSHLETILISDKTHGKNDSNTQHNDEHHQMDRPSALISVIADKTTTEDLNDDTVTKSKQIAVMDDLGGIVSFLPDVRAHFFGRDDDNETAWGAPRQQEELVSLESSSFRPRIVMGRRVPNKKITPEKMQLDKPFIVIPSRTAAALIYLRMMSSFYQNQMDNVDDHRDRLIIQRSLLEHAFPICASLTDSTRPIFTALGASSFICLYESLIVIRNGLPAVALDRSKEEWDLSVTNSLTVLQMAFQGSRVGPVLVAIGQAQCLLLGTYQNTSSVQDTNSMIRTINERRRSTTQKWLSALYVSTGGHASQQMSSLDLLRGGIIPLLLQHTDDRTGVPADAMEIGRLGLKALLLLIDDEFVNTNNDDRTKIASCVALINLFWAVHPILPHHGGKIMTHLLSLSASSAPVSSSTSSSLSTAKQTTIVNTTTPQQLFFMYTSAVALVMCGPKFTQDVMDDILTRGGGSDDEEGTTGSCEDEEIEYQNYQPVLVDVARRIQDAANELTRKEEEEEEEDQHPAQN